jgi:hypothetical protein
MFIYSFILALVCGFNVNFSEFRSDKKKWFGMWALMTGIYVPLIWLTFYLFLPSVIAPFLSLFIIFAVFFGVNLIVHHIRAGEVYNSESPVSGTVFYIVFIVILVVMALNSSACFRSADYYKMIGDVEVGDWKKDVPPIDMEHMRIVSESQAKYLSDKVLGESKDVLGSKYEMGKVTICKVKDQLIWVAPIEFKGIFQWAKFDTTPGFVMVSAEDNNSKPVLVDNLNLRYMESAFFGDSVRRHLYTNGFMNYIIGDFTFELDDNYKPFYTVSVMKPTIGFGGRKVVGIAIVDPENGNISFYENEKVPEWIDRIIPESIADEYMNDWGAYKNGYLNTLFAKEGLKEPTPWPYGSDVWLILGNDKRTYFYTGITSKSNSDQALIGIMLMDTRTGKTFMYNISGNNEQAIYDAVNNKLGADSGKWVATMPIPYEAYGTLSYVVPVIGREQAILQKIAIVRGDNLNVALGNDKREAFNEYRIMLSKDGNKIVASKNVDEKELTGTIIRISSPETLLSGSINYFLLLNEMPDKLLEVNSSQFPEIKVTKPGDKVALVFFMTQEEIFNVNKFDNLEISLSKSVELENYDRKWKTNEEDFRVPEKAKEFDENFKNLSPEEKAKLLETMKKKN